MALASALSLCALWWVDALWSATPLDPHLLVCGMCLALSVGALVGAAASLTYTLTDAIPYWLRRMLWPSVAMAAGVEPAIRLGAIARLNGPYSSAAWLVLSGAAAVGLLLGWLMALSQEHARPDGLTRSVRMRRGVTWLCLLVTGTTFCVDRIMYVGLYPDAHHALRACAFVTLGLALLLSAGPLRLRPIGWREAALLALIGSVPLWATLPAQEDALRTFGQRPWSLTLLRSARWLLDVDRDGASALLSGGDCDDTDPAVHPFAREVADNGIDDNCVFGDARPLPEHADDTPLADDPSPLSVVLITVDTLTYNRIGSYDPRYGRLGRNTMPNLEAWSKGATLFRQAYAAGGWTSISLATLMRGVYARKLRWERFQETSHFRLIRAQDSPALAADETLIKTFPLAWRDPHRPLAAWLQRRAMRTHAVVDDGFSSMLSGSVGCNEGFDRYEEIDQQPAHRRNDAATADLAIAALHAARNDGTRFFLWVHFFGPHTPHETHQRVRLYGDSIADRYDHEVRFVDDELGRLLSALASSVDDTAVFITADHGEAFGKGHRGHGSDLAESTIRVPLIARVPGWPHKTVGVPVSLVDVMPTILELTHTPAPAWLDGVSLSRIVRDPRHVLARALYADTWQYPRAGEPSTDLVAAFDGTRKVVLNRVDQTLQAHFQEDAPSGEPSAPEHAPELTTRLLAYLEQTGGPLRLAP